MAFTPVYRCAKFLKLLLPAFVGSKTYQNSAVLPDLTYASISVPTLVSSISFRYVEDHSLYSEWPDHIFGILRLSGIYCSNSGGCSVSSFMYRISHQPFLPQEILTYKKTDYVNKFHLQPRKPEVARRNERLAASRLVGGGLPLLGFGELRRAYRSIPTVYTKFRLPFPVIQ
jgi:hypothetical protein